MPAATFTRKLLLTALLASGLAAGACHAQQLTIAAQIDQTVRKAADAGKFSGAVLVAKKGEVLYREAFGPADRATSQPNTPATKFAIASLSKPFTAVLVMQLVEEGKLKINDRLDAIFPNLVGKPSGAVTLGQLLAHTSGMEEIVERHMDAALNPTDLEDAKITSPGKHRYTSSTYVVLKLVIEKVSGQDYATRLKDRILTPAGMTDTGVLYQGKSPNGLAVGYVLKGKTATPAATSYPIERVEGAGTLYSTLDDLAKFDRALAGNVILSAASQKLMYANHTSGGSPWGYGWALGEQGGRSYPWHKGDIAGYTAVFVRQVQRDELIVILSNVEAADLTPLRQQILRILKDAATER